jgi:glutamate formiminotransferase
MKIIEIVPNVSEGCHPERIARLRDSLAQPGVRVAHVDPCRSAHRTVFTAFGPPEAIVTAAKALVETALAIIDLREHAGTHPRVGAVDVCPFVPFADATIADASAAAIELGRYAGELGIPTILYEESATRPSQKNLPAIRRGGLSEFTSRIESGDLIPDFGPSVPHSSAGGLVAGARHPLVAFNIQLVTKDVAVAMKIARSIRSTSASWSSHSLSATRALGWYSPERGCAEVSCNLLDHRKTTLLTIFQTVSRLARDEGTRVHSSDIIGLVPRQALADCSSTADLEEAVFLLGLNRVRPFSHPERLVEHQLSLC